MLRLFGCVVVLAAFCACLEVPPLADGLVVRCAQSAECPVDQVCVVDAGVCVDADDACVVVDNNGDAAFADDGAACDAGICVGHVCQAPRCGDRIVTLERGETCDSDDGCRDSCTRCGDNFVDDGEDCDDGADNSDGISGACRTSCLRASCGDGVRDPGEACDEGDLNSDVIGGACRTSCVRASCGDGTVDPGEVCDGRGDDGAVCRADCSKVEVCGDGFVDVGEECDDADLNPADGCDACALQTFREELVVSAELATPATPLEIARVGHVAVDARARIVVADIDALKVLRIDTGEGIEVTAVAGNGTRGRAGDGGTATLAQLDAPFGVAVDDARQRIYVADANNHCVRVIDGNGAIATYAGNGSADPGDSGPQHRLDAGLVFPTALALDARGNLLITEQGGGRIRRVNVSTDVIETVAGSGTVEVGGRCRSTTACSINLDCNTDGEQCVDGFCSVRSSGPDDCGDPDGAGPLPPRTFIAAPPRPGEPAVRAIDASVSVPTAVTVADNGDVFFTDFVNHVVYRVDEDGFIEVVLGTRRVNAGFAGDGGPARAARINSPNGLVVVGDDLFVAEQGNHIIRRVNLVTRTVDTFAGTPPAPAIETCHPFDEFFVGFGGAACAQAFPGTGPTSLDAPLGLVKGRTVTELIVTETNARTVRALSLSTATLSPIAGAPASTRITTSPSTSLTGLISPGAMAVNDDGEVFVADLGIIPIIGAGPGPSLLPGPDVLHPQIVRLGRDGLVSRVAGTGVAGAGPDGDATNTDLAAPRRLAFDAGGTLHIADGGRLRRLTGDQLETLALPDGITGVTQVARDGDRVVALSDDGRSVLAVDESGVGVVATSPLLPDFGFLLDLWESDDGSVYVGGVTALDENFSDFRFELFHLEGDALVVVPFDATALLPLYTVAFTLQALVESAPFAFVVVDHNASVVRRFFADGRSVVVAGNGLEGCRPGERVATCLRLSDNNTPPAFADIDGDDTDVAAPAADEAQLSAPLRLQQRCNLFFPGLDDLEPDTNVPRRFATQRRFDTAQLARAPDGTLLLSEQPTTAIEIRSFGTFPLPLGDDAARIRRIDLDNNRMSTLIGPVHPTGPGPATLPTRLYQPNALALVPGGLLVSGAFGRVARVSLDDAGSFVGVDVVVGIGSDFDAVVGATAAPVLPLLRASAGVAVSDDHVVVLDDRVDGSAVLSFAAGDLRDPASWVLERVDVVDDTDDARSDFAGVSYDAELDRFLIVDAGASCVRAYDTGVGIGASVAGRCGEANDFGAFLDAPSAAIGARGAVFVSDTGNHRVMRFDDADTATLLIGDGTPSVAGSGAPAREFSIATPRQLAFDDFGNLYVTSDTVVRLITDVLDDDPDNDAVSTIFGKERGAYPASSAFCLAGLVVDGDAVLVADGCQNFLVRLRRVHP